MKSLLILAVTLLAAACGSKHPAAYELQLETALAHCTPSRADSLRAAIADAPVQEREALTYLIAFMPNSDRDTIPIALLHENVEYACRARTRFPWCSALPDSIFQNEVLPYAAADETRDSWRADFYDRFSARVAGCLDLRSAIDSVNRHIATDVGVEYNTLREKANQSPAESMRQHMASCTGLSILLVDALRSVGIPARFAGTPAWHDDRGNHSWVEVWIDGQWHFTEYYPDEAGLDHAWFLADAGQADPDDRLHGIWAVSFRPTGGTFPMEWAADADALPGVNVTQRYTDLWQQEHDTKLAQGSHVRVAFRMYRNRAHTTRSGDRIAANVDVFCDDAQMGGGRTASPMQDMNDDLTFLLPKNRTYTFRYENNRGEPATVTARVGEQPLLVTGYME